MKNHHPDIPICFLSQILILEKEIPKCIIVQPGTNLGRMKEFLEKHLEYQNAAIIDEAIVYEYRDRLALDRYYICIKRKRIENGEFKSAYLSKD